MAQSSVQKSLNKARASKKQLCEGKVNKTAVKLAVANYVSAANAKAEKTITNKMKLKARKAEIQKIAAGIKQSGCSMNSRVSGAKK